MRKSIGLPPAEVVEQMLEEAKPEQQTRAKGEEGPFRTSIYFHPKVHDVLRRIAFDERSSVTALVHEGLEHVLKARGYPPPKDIKES